MTTPHAVEKAKADVARLMQAEVDLSHRRAAKLAEGAGADGGCALAGQLAGDDSAVTAAAERVTRIAGEAAALGSAVDAARRARTAAITTAWQAEAALKREEAAQLRIDADARQPRTDALLAELAEHEGIAYVPGPRPVPLGAGMDHPLAYGLDSTWPRTRQIRYHADMLDQEAEKLEARTIERRGAVRGSDAAELFAAVAANAFALGPTLDEITAWVAKAEPAARQAWRMDRLSKHRPVDDASWHALASYTISWQASGIDAGRSSIDVQRDRDARGVAI